MIIKEQISKFFYPNQLNNQKEQELYQKAIDIRNYKNYISKEIHSDILNSSLLSKFDFIKKFSTLEVENLSGKDKEWAIVEVMSTYRNEFSRIKSLLKFDVFDKVNYSSH